MTAILTSKMMDAWTSLPADVRSALVQSELASSSRGLTTGESTESMTSTSSESGDGLKDKFEEFHEKDPKTGARVTMRPLERASKNVFAFTKTTTSEQISVERKPSATVTTKTTIVSTTRGWRNVFSLPISYDVNVVPHGTLLDPTNPQLLESTGVHPEGYNRRFAVVDAEVDKIYGEKIRGYFSARDIELHTITLVGGEADKRPEVSRFKSPTNRELIGLLSLITSFCISGC
jgi:hypothetical protein